MGSGISVSCVSFEGRCEVLMSQSVRAVCGVESTCPVVVCVVGLRGELGWGVGVVEGGRYTHVITMPGHRLTSI